jgi:hypothetical protein
MPRDERVEQILQLLSDDPDALELVVRLAKRLSIGTGAKMSRRPKSHLTT